MLYKIGYELIDRIEASIGTLMRCESRLKLLLDYFRLILKKTHSRCNARFRGKHFRIVAIIEWNIVIF